MRASLLLALLLLPATARAQPLSTDRPDFTEAAATVPRLQIETGATGTRTAGQTSYTFGEGLLRWPLLPRLEGRLQGALERAAGAWSASDVAVGAKLGLREASPALAVIASLGLAAFTGDDRVEGAVGEVKLIGSVTVAPGVALASNLNVAALRDAAELSASLSLGVDLTPRLGAFLEGFVLQPVGGSGECPAAAGACAADPAARPFVNAGLTFRPAPTFQLDARLGAGHARTVFAGVGATVRL